MIDALALARLLQLASPMLPVGAYSYSQGLEWAIEERTVHDANSAEEWVGDVLKYAMCSFELPILLRMCHAWRTQNEPLIEHWNTVFCAGRETAESYAETMQMGYSLNRLLQSLHADQSKNLERLQLISIVSFPAAYAFAVSLWKIPFEAAVQAYAWSWIENQISAAMKLIPLGQTDGQRVLYSLGSRLPNLLETVYRLEDDDLSNFAPGLALAGCRHEIQYSRLFRS